MENYQKLLTLSGSSSHDEIAKFKKELMRVLHKNKDSPRFNGEIKYEIDKILPLCSSLGDEGDPPTAVLQFIIGDLCKYSPNWTSRNLHYNVGAPTNILASMVYGCALDNNIFTINDAMSGNSLIAEKAVVNIMSELANVEKNNAVGWFTFGGTAINLYALRVGIIKSNPSSSSTGIKKGTKVFTSQNAHFSHGISAEWLGIGTDNVIVVSTNKDGTTNKGDFEEKLKKELKEGNLIACIYLNGGTSYSHVIDDISWFVDKRNELIEEFSLSYSPHIHIDSVIGWFWLFFNDYDFKSNPLAIPNISIDKIKKQYNKISNVNLADSWGCDFHKGIGGCPVDTSLFILNNKNDSNLLSKKHSQNVQMHQIAEEFSTDSPVNFTLENSRSAGPMLAALASLKSMGRNGFRRYLSNLVLHAQLLRMKLNAIPGIFICDQYNLGFVVMVRLYPSFIPLKNIGNDVFHGDRNVTAINEYNEAFFKWDYRERMSKSLGVEFSYSSSFLVTERGVGIHALKIYLMSPFLKEDDIDNCIGVIVKQKNIFDALAIKSPNHLLNSDWVSRCAPSPADNQELCSKAAICQF